MPGITKSDIEQGRVVGFIDYNDTTGPITLLANVWTDLPNNGQGAFTNKSYRPVGVSELMDNATGEIDPTGLDLGDVMFIRNDFTVTPQVNDSALDFRYVLGDGAGEYFLE